MTYLRSPLHITLLYLFIAVLWLFGSDGLLTQVDPIRLAHYQQGKGLLFMLVSALILYLALHRLQASYRNAHQLLVQREERLALAMDSSREALWDWDLRSQSIFFSARYCEILGCSPADFELSRQAWSARLHPDDRAAAEQRLDAALRGDQVLYESAYRMRHRDGSYRWVLSRGQIQLDAMAAPIRFVGTMVDVTQRRADAESLRQAAAVFTSTQEGVLVTNLEKRIIHVNPAFTRITGYGAEEVLGCFPSVVKSGRHGPEFYQRVWADIDQHGAWSGEVWNRRKNGEIFPIWQSIRVVRDDQGAPSSFVAVFSDISAIKQSQHELEYLAHYDPLTALPNRLLFIARAEQSLQRARRDKRPCALLLCDLDHFKLINESLGHSSGDLLLKLIADRLSERVGSDLTLARLGGDEFGLVCENCSGEQAAHWAQQLLEGLQQPFVVDGQSLFIGASLGISLFPEDGSSVEELMRNADSALFRAKDDGRQGYRFYNQGMTVLALQRVTLETELRTALEQDQLRVYFQPLHRLDDGQMVGAEALVRWQHPERGLVPPGAFIPAAEESGLITALDIWVLEHACRQMARWRDQGAPLRSVAVNISSRLFAGELDQQVAQVLQDCGLAAQHLEIEVTESAVMEDADRAQEQLVRLRQLGVRLAIDDFGTGYSSLARLKRLPLDKLKLDQSFVAGLPHDPNDAAIARAVISLGHSMGLAVLAEGIETQAQADFLRELGCDYGQGYWFGRPQPAAQLLP
jgi:diguanylate cyclase (GGDEF)-like protein/PAS domain S-box-containing protein